MSAPLADCIRDGIPLTPKQAVEWAYRQQYEQRVLVCGSRDAAPDGRAERALRAILVALRPSSIVHGAAKGVDAAAARWAREMEIPEHTYPADWSLGPKAGPLRNERMAAEGGATLCLAIHHGTRGTADMVRRARAHGIVTCEVWP